MSALAGSHLSSLLCGTRLWEETRSGCVGVARPQLSATVSVRKALTSTVKSSGFWKSEP